MAETHASQWPLQSSELSGLLHGFDTASDRCSTTDDRLRASEGAVKDGGEKLLMRTPFKIQFAELWAGNISNGQAMDVSWCWRDSHHLVSEDPYDY